MKLDRVEIKNFRSIKNIEIAFDPTCRVLVGITESGKSNILKALTLLSDDSQPSNDDVREALSTEGEIEESCVLFVFRLEENEFHEVIESVSSKILANTENPTIVSVYGKPMRIRKFCTHYNRNEGLYDIDILKEKKTFKYWALGKNYKILPGWKKPTNLCPSGFSVDLGDHSYELAQYKLVRAADFSDIPDGYLEDAEIGDLGKLHGQTVMEITRENLPKALFWEYDESSFLPDSVGIAEFSEDPDSCIPLKNMFSLANIENIKQSIDRARKGSDNKFQSYLDRIANKATRHLRKVWKEHRGIEFSLDLNADRINPGIKEKNIHDFARRSDGFKRFVTFLLMVSANVETDKIRNTLLLIDEPGIGLHPSATRHLRNELLRISRKNYVVYSTHSIFMIDNENIQRHYIVKKKNEITTIESAEESIIVDEEVLYKALGYSVFSILEEKNLIFEGWKDKHLFRVVLENVDAGLAKKYESVRTSHIKGVRMARFVTPIIELANRKCLIVSDSDKPAKDEKKKYEQARGFGSWKTYQDIDSSIEAITGEDFIKNDFIAKQINSILSDKEIPAFDETDLLDKKNKLLAIRKWLKDNTEMTDEQKEETVKKIKDSIFDNLKYENIDLEEYLKLFKGISF